MARKKTVTFALTHMSVAFAVGWTMTGDMAVGGALALVEPLVNTVAYFLHEKVWERSVRRGAFDRHLHGSWRKHELDGLPHRVH